jgi:small-conductance mechanosensitive channel
MIELLRQTPWLAALGAALLAVFTAMAAHRVARKLLPRLAGGDSTLLEVLRAIDGPAAAVLPLAALQLVWLAADDGLRYIGMLRHLNAVLLIAAITWLITATISGLAQVVINRNPITVADNLHARRVQTQARVLARSAQVLVVVGGTAIALMTFPGARQVGASLLASAGVLGIIGGLAARPVFSNLIAGLQLALAQPIRLDDVLIVEGEWGRVEEITGTYVVLKIWDERRLIVPLQWFIENPFQNWTRTSSQILGSVMLYVDYATPVDAIRAEAKRLAEAAEEWDRRVFAVQVTDTSERAMQVRVLVSAAHAGAAFDLRCKLREGLLAYLAREYPQCLPLVRGPSGAAPRDEDALPAA